MSVVALLSAYDKQGLAGFARELRTLGWDLLGSAGTAKYLNEQGIRTCDIAKFVGPPILGHKVATLSREIHAALLANESSEEQAELERIGIPRIDLVYVNLYPLEAAVGNPKRTLQSVLEKTDIGGPTMLRAAAKGRRFVLHSPEQFPAILEYIKTLPQSRNENEHQSFISMLAYHAERAVTRYSSISAKYQFEEALRLADIAEAYRIASEKKPVRAS